MEVRRLEIAAHEDVGQARAAARAVMHGRSEASQAAAVIIASELVTNALLHGGGHSGIVITPTATGARIEVTDASRRTPLVALASNEMMTGRGLRMVSQLASSWGVDPVGHGKVVWAEIVDDTATAMGETGYEVASAWTETLDGFGAPDHVVVNLGRVPTALLVAAKGHVDNLVREFTLAARGGESGTTAPVPAPLAALIDRVVHGFEDARLEIKRQATQAARTGASHAVIELHLPLQAADAAAEYLQALDEVDSYSRANRLLTLETPPQHRVFRRWYIGEIIKQLHAAAKGETPPPVVPFEQRLLDEMDAAEHARRTAERAARLYTVAVALAAAVTPEDVAAAVLQEGVGALGAAGGGVLLATEDERLFVPATVGYADPVVARLREEARDADLPAAFALRTGEAVWLETIEERDARFPALAGFEPETIAMCAIPVSSADGVLGALRFSFTERRLFDEDEQRFVLALAAETSQALQRARISALLQESLLPAALPDVPGIELGAAYSSAGAAVGGDFYDVFSLAPRRWGVTMGDVRGRGPRAAALTALTRYTIRTAARLGRGPAEVLEVLNAAMAAERDDEQFCTAVFAIVDVGLDAALLTVANGGHPPVALLRDGQLTFIKPTGGLLGVLDDATFGEETLSLAPGDALVLYTDGISEARAGIEEFGDVRLAEFLRQFQDAPAQELADGVIAASQAFRSDAANDDAAVFVLRVGSAPD